MAGNARRFDDPDANGKDLEREASGVGRPGSPPALPDAALRIEQTLGYRVRVEAVYRQYDIDHGHSTCQVIRASPRCGSFRTGPKENSFMPMLIRCVCLVLRLRRIRRSSRRP
jgi:hypothetical protein